ncbi:hypothetical protein WN55_00733 [Dufourea novaeangliae]|uniref:Uncharacterized protein n=1 Tax=Dufourea novaeangliae TaxID=178035 RepID=A0A154NYF8_DUFNO|nr:hypothetical protein WN55_00733 [Dufourea novaeangliae]
MLSEITLESCFDHSTMSTSKQRKNSPNSMNRSSSRLKSKRHVRKDGNFLPVVIFP